MEPLADHLQEKYISKETYSRICKENTTQDQMRELYKALNTKASKSAFYEALKETDPSLLEELLEESFPTHGSAGESVYTLRITDTL